MNQPPTEKLNAQVDIKNTTPVECEKCKCQTFFMQQTVMLRNVSAIVSPSGKAGLLPLPVSFSCSACGHVNDQFLPPELRKNPIVKASSIVV
jgi:DNA-directed RNA polymerase subunit RPC12/RpoP